MSKRGTLFPEQKAPGCPEKKGKNRNSPGKKRPDSLGKETRCCKRTALLRTKRKNAENGKKKRSGPRRKRFAKETASNGGRDPRRSGRKGGFGRKNGGKEGTKLINVK